MFDLNLIAERTANHQWTEDGLGQIDDAGDVGGDIQLSGAPERRFALKLDNGEFAVLSFCAYVASEHVDDDHGPVPATWFGHGMWPTCKCGFAPRDNAKLNEHWAENNLKVVDDHGELKVTYLDAWVQMQVHYCHCTDLEDVGGSEGYADIRYWDGPGQGMTTLDEAKKLIADLTQEDLSEAVFQMGI